MKKILLLSLFFLALLAACSRNYEGSTPKLVIWHHEDASVIPFLQSRFELFEKSQGGKVKIEQVHYDPEDLHQQYLTAAVAGAGPDIVLTANDKAGIFVAGKFILPVENIFDMNSYVKVAIDAISEEGHVWGIPASTGNHLMLFYNKKLAPVPPATTDDFITISKNVMREHKGTFGFATNLGEPYFFIPWLTSFGGWLIDGTTPTLDTQPMRDALTFYGTLKNFHKITPTECDYNCMDGLFKEGRVAFIINGDWAIDSYRKTLGNDFGITMMPVNNKTGTPLRPMIGGKYFLFNANLNGERLKRAVDFAHFFNELKNQTAQFKELGRLPGTNEAFNKAKRNASPIMKTSFEQLARGPPSPMQVEMRAIWDSMRSQMHAFWTGEKTAGEAAAYMQKDAERKIKEMRIK